MAKQLIFHEEARAKIKKGVDTVADAVSVTIGPFGRNVALQKSYGGPTITNDGVSIARDITLEDSFENIGAEIIKEVANKTNELAGDGTSTSVVLAQSMAEEGLKQIDKGVNALSVRRGMEKAHADGRRGLLSADEAGYHEQRGSRAYSFCFRGIGGVRENYRRNRAESRE